MSKYTYIICGKLYNGIDAEFKEGYKILVKDNKIEAVGREIPQPETAEVVDLSDATVTPGMIDAHMHMDYIDWHTIREEVYTTSEEAKSDRDHQNCTENTFQRIYNSQTSGRNYFEWFWSSGCKKSNRKRGISQDRELWQHLDFCVRQEAMVICRRDLQEIRNYLI